MSHSAWSTLLKHALLRAGCLRAAANDASEPFPCAEPCLLSQVLSDLQCANAARSHGSTAHQQLCECIESALDRGFTLRERVPHVSAELMHEWLGGRLVLMHSHWLRHSTEWTSLVSSRLGRYGRELPQWPSICGRALESLRRNDRVLLTVPGTTVTPLLEPLLIQRAIECVRFELPNARMHSVAEWLTEQLIAQAKSSTDARSGLSLSPASFPASSAMENLPLQDRVAMCCARQVYALRVQSGGTIDCLLKNRLAEPRFPSGCVFVWVPRSQADRKGTREFAAAHMQWLDAGSVGWYLLPRCQDENVGSRYRHVTAPWCDTYQPSLVQLTSPYWLCHGGEHSRSCTASGHSLASSTIENSFMQQQAGLPDYLVHCVRGGQGQLSPAAATDRLLDAWAMDRLFDETPLDTLLKVLRSGRLRARSALIRGQATCVSFSAVPLDELLQRRSFQSHLGRWDWEPFGVLVRRSELERLGARPVIYGDSATYQTLSPEERPFFQPAMRRSPQSTKKHWFEEREWRVLGDVRFRELPAGAIEVFVSSARQAQAVARMSAWPVIWLTGDRTPTQQDSLKSRRRKAVQTSRN